MIALSTWAALGLQCLAAAVQSAPYAPEQALATFQHDPKVRVELVASEPLVFDPVALCFDARGRLFVVENRGYPTDADPPRGDVVLLEDGNGDGRMDTRTVFAEGFDFPNGLMAWKDGILLTCAPDLLYLADTDADGHADVREVVLTGFAPGGSTQLRTSHPTLNLDGWIYFTNGLSGGEVRLPGAPENEAIKMGAMDLRWNPWDNRIEKTAGQAQFGQAFDDLGNKFVCSNRKHIEQVMMQPGDFARNAALTKTTCVAEIPDHDEAAKLFPVSKNITTAYTHTGTFTAACGLAIYRGTAMGEGFYGNAFVCDPTGNLIHRDILDYGVGAAAVARRAYPDREFLASPDNWFRPVFLANGPDGALYVCDMYRKTIEHPVYLPPEIAARTDFQSGRDMGRIYRIVAADAPPYKSPRTLDTKDFNGLLHALSAENAWPRDTAFRLLLEPTFLEQRGPALQKLCRDASPRTMVCALRLLSVLHHPYFEALDIATAHDSPAVRESALRVFRDSRHQAEHIDRPALPDFIASRIRTLLHAGDPSLRFHAALAAGELPGYGDTSVPYDGPAHEQMGDDLAALVLANPDDPWIAGAAFSSASNCSSDFTAACFARLNQGPRRDEAAFLELAEMAGRAVGHLHVPKLFPKTDTSTPGTPPEPWQLSALAGCLDAMKASKPDKKPEAIERIAPKGMLDAVPGIAADEKAAPLVRVLAVRLLAHLPFEQARNVLQPLLQPETDPELQLAAIRALGATGAPEVGAMLTAPATWAAFSSDARTATKAAVFSRGDWIDALLDEIERGALPPYTLDPAARDQLMKSGDKAIAARAQKLFANLRGEDREKVFEEYKSILALSGHREAGHAVFTNTCAQCHVFQGEGHKVGPELSDIRAQTPDYILLHLLVPNKAVTAGFESYTVSTKSLETYSGILAEQNAQSVTLRQALGVEQHIDRANIESLSTENRSLMPDELEKSLDKQQLRDLIAYLKGEDDTP